METWGALDKAEAMKRRTKEFAMRIVKLYQALPKTEEARVIGRQVLRSGTSVGANYRAVCRARSGKEFVSKMNVVLEEADETVFWFELLAECGVVSEKKMSFLVKEGNELLAIFGAALRTARKNLKKN
jgi:four helix bundle protein